MHSVLAALSSLLIDHEKSTSAALHSLTTLLNCPNMAQENQTHRRRGRAVARLLICAASLLVSMGCSGSSNEPKVGMQKPFADSPDPPADQAPTGEPWSNPDTWGGKVPEAGAAVTIPPDKTILLDVPPPALGGLTIEGVLTFAEEDLELTADWIMVHGKLQIGRANRPFPNKAILTLTGSEDAPSPMGGTRGLMVHGGVLDLHSVAPSPTWTRLNESSEVGATTLTLEEEIDWKSEDQVVVAPTNFFDVDKRTELGSVSTSEGTSLSLNAGLAQFHWGVLQYVQNNDESPITLTPSNEVTEKVIDERAEVGNLTRNIVIRGVEDDLWKDQGFGAHVMVMNPGVARVSGVEFYRVGQAGELARYPFHWHLWSYDAEGKERGDVDNQYIRDSAIWNSAQRCIVIHGTNGALISNNICYDIDGHAIFLEDAVERRNTLEGNLVLAVDAIPEEHLLLKHERRPAGFWLTNPDNVVRGNAVADTAQHGYWYALPQAPLGLNKGVALKPSLLPFGVFEDNVAHSTFAEALMFDIVPIDDDGNTSALAYQPSVGGVSGEVSPFAAERLTVYKVGVNSSGPIWDRVTGGTFRDFVVADFGGSAFAGASRCTIEKNLVVGNTLNNEGNDKVTAAAVGTASYHSLCRIENNTFVNLPAVKDDVSGAFAADDYYITGVDLGLSYNAGTTFINAHPGYRSPSPNTVASGSGLRHFALAGALWDPYGYWGEAGNYWVYDLPFLTEGGGCASVRDDFHGNDVSCSGPYFGISAPQTTVDTTAEITKPIRFTREDASGNDLSEWFIDDGACTKFLGHMRHAALVNGGIYRIEFPAGEQQSDLPPDGGPCKLAGPEPPTDRVEFNISNMKRPEDWVMLGVPFKGTVNPETVYVTSWANPQEAVGWGSWECYQAMRDGAASCPEGGVWQDQFRGDHLSPLESVGSKQEVLDDATCGSFFQDKGNDRVWLKVCRQDLAQLEGDPFISQIALYQRLYVVIQP